MQEQLVGQPTRNREEGLCNRCDRRELTDGLFISISQIATGYSITKMLPPKLSKALLGKKKCSEEKLYLTLGKEEKRAERMPGYVAA